MSVPFSVRDVQFHASTKGVRIIVYTDIPCHLFCRLTLEQPLIHKRPVFRRGLWLNDDVRFCFTVFEDNEQFEAGDTTIHTFWKTDWPVCTTKFCYFFASIDGTFSVSTSPIFEYHNDGIDPVPPPRMLETYTSIEPQRHFNTGNLRWELQDSSPYVDENATGLVIHCLNRDVGAERLTGCRKTNSAVWSPASMLRDSQAWAIVGLDADKKWELYGHNAGWQDWWVMGYFNDNVVFPDNHLDLSPAVLDAWVDVDVGSVYPEAIAGIFDIGPLTTSPPFYGLRQKGSADARIQNAYHSWSIMGLDVNGLAQVRFDSWPTDKNHLHLVGYFKSHIECHLNAILIADPPLGAWTDRLVANLTAKPDLVCIEHDSNQANVDAGCRKPDSYRDIKLTPQRKCWIFTHPNHIQRSEFYRNHANTHYYLCAEIED